MRVYKALLFLAMMLAPQLLFGQSVSMHINLTDGQTLTYSTDSVKLLTFDAVRDSEFSVIRINLPDRAFDFNTTFIDSSEFFQDASGKERLRLSPAYTYSLVGPHNNYSDLPIDSITFAFYQQDQSIRELPRNFLDTVRNWTGGGEFHMGVWSGSTIIATSPLTRIAPNSDSTWSQGVEYYPATSPQYIATNSSGTRLLSRKGENSGPLVERDLTTGIDTLLVASSSCSSGRYLPGSNDLIYYSYGSYSDSLRNPSDAGYYLLERSSGKRTFLLPWISELDLAETINGFDVSPDGRKLLLPSVGNNRTPLAIEYDLTSHAFDTVDGAFAFERTRLLLWLRYSHDGSRIVYSNYNQEALKYASVSSETGIIDRATKSRRVINTAPTTHGSYSAVFPEWSSDDSELVYGSVYDPINTGDYISFFQLYLKRLSR